MMTTHETSMIKRNFTSAMKYQEQRPKRKALSVQVSRWQKCKNANSLGGEQLRRYSLHRASLLQHGPCWKSFSQFSYARIRLLKSWPNRDKLHPKLSAELCSIIYMVLNFQACKIQKFVSRLQKVTYVGVDSLCGPPGWLCMEQKRWNLCCNGCPRTLKTAET